MRVLRPKFRKDRQMTPGERLRAALDAALAREAQQSGRQLEWDERDTHHLDAAARCADRVDLLQSQLDAELAGENRASVVVKISAELRALDRAVAEHLGKIQVGVPAKSERHVAAVRARWERRDAAWAAARDGGA
jgi:hypothetical protein